MKLKKILLIPLILTILLSFAAFAEKEAKIDDDVKKLSTPTLKLGQPAIKSQEEAKASDETEKPATPNLPTNVGVEEAKASVKLIDAKTVIEIIVDSSGSMNGLVGNRQKMELVQQALKDSFQRLIKDEAKDIKVGLRFYGHQSEASENDCKDSKLEYSIGELKVLDINKTIDSIKAKGTTPLAYSLSEAGKDLPAAQDADNIIVVITDGVDACGGDPCKIAEAIHEKGSQATIHVIGFDLNQEAQKELSCIADKGAGIFFLARDENELFSSVDQAINAATPYNLRLQVLSGATPLNATLTVYEAGTGNVVRRDQTSGVKLYRLAPGQYDILVEFTGSAQIDKPSKILKGVEIGPSGKVEQRVSFSTGQIKLLAYNKDGKPTLTEYLFTESGKDKIIAKVNTEQNSETFYLTPGKYDITAENVNDLSLKMKINLADVEVKEGQLLEKLIRFQTGQLFVKAINANKEPIPITYRVTPVGRRHEILSKGEFSKEGGVVDLAPGNYDVYVEETIPDAVINPQSKTSDVTLTSGEVTEITANVISGTLKIKGIDSTKHEVYTDYVIRDAKTREDVAFTHSEKDFASISLPPGEYAIISTHSHSSYTPKPVMELPLVRILGGETTTETVTFKLGGLKLVGRNTKEFIISTKFIIYRSGSEEEITTAIGKDDWVYFDLPEGLYDVKAVDNTTAGNNPPTIWMRDVNIENGKVTVKEAVYTNGKIKLIARGQNNTVIECDFKIYEYGTDGAIFSGKTSDQWLTFDIEPGRYYLEGAFKDVENHQTLKKWISLIVNENQIVETIIRF